MVDSETYKEMFRRLRCCVIVPTYNNSQTLGKVLDGVLSFTSHVIVVNDGSTDNTRHVLENYHELTVVSYSRNRGKGFALRTGFNTALDLGYDYAITIDSDGQHHPEDIPLLLDRINTDPGALLIGSRNLDQDGIPKGTSFGNRFSNFWFNIETGVKLPDTQSGYRLYPIRRLKDIRFVTRRFEFEIEVLVRAAWKGIRIIAVPVGVHYPSKKERVSHFRPFTDFARISLLNTVLVLMALLFVRPFLFIRTLDRENIRIFYRRYLLSPHESNFKKAASIGLGICLGIMPVWGWQMAIAIALAHFFRLNKVLTVVASNISIPPMIPFILWGSYALGGLIIDSPTELQEGAKYTLEFVRDNLFQYITGAVALALAMGLLTGLLTLGVLALFRRKKPLQEENDQATI
jgi:glycosyltransferase involved in cell wall biosynthesis